MDKNKQNERIRAIKAKYYSKIRSLFDKSLGREGDAYSKIDGIEKCIKECEKELSQFKRDEHKKNQIHVQTFESFNNEH